ncbi:PHP domain-containing protein, partial [bacterium]|nr:PHP domain-containing protein [bacterium]
MAGFVHLHVHSNFSFMDGVPSPQVLLDRAADLGMPALALTDHQGLYGAIRFYQAALKAGVKPIVGTEIVVEAVGLEGGATCEGDLPPDNRLSLSAPVGFGRASAAGFHLTLLAKDLTGYRNLCRLLSRTHVRTGDDPSVVTLAELERCAEGLIGLSGCTNGETGAAVLAGLGTRAERALRRLERVFAPGDFYVELMHTMTPDSSRYIAALVALATRIGLPVVATNNVHYLERPGFRLHDVLASAGARTSLPGPYNRPNGELWLKPAGEMRRLFADVPQACDNTLAIAERCTLDLGLGSFHFPAADVPAGESAYSVLSKAAWRGLEQRYRPVTPEAVRRLQDELSVIQDLGFPEYFLVVKDIVDFAK